MATIELTGLDLVRVLRAQLRAEGLPDDDRSVVELANRVATRGPARAHRIDELHSLFGVPRAIRGDD